MKNLYTKPFIILLILVLQISVDAQRQVDLNHTVQLEVVIDENMNQAELFWDDFEGTDTYFVFKRKFGESSWGAAEASLTAMDTSFIIEDVSDAELYEYKISRSAASGFAEGYLTSGFNVYNYPFERGLIFISESSITDTLSEEIDLMIKDIEMEGWNVSHFSVSKDDTPIQVKLKILDVYLQNPTMYKSILLFGHIPVPYSGVIGPDGHGDHIGAWPCDAFYGSVNGLWTDMSATNTSASQSRHHNVPGDGKFDQSTFISDIDLAVGRIDFANLPLFTESEIELLSNYVNKNHRFRTGKIKAMERGLIENNFNLAEGFGQSGIKNFTSFFGRDNVDFRDYDVLKSESYLWSYGAGGGNYQGASGISNTTNLNNDSLQTVFTMLFGSYFGDWDSNNNFLRSALASGTCLSNAWAGRPVWMFHPMAMGFTLGDCTLLTQNNFNQYVTGFGARQIHIALMGDPTLKMYYPEPATDFSVKENSGSVDLVWNFSPDPDVTHYFIYRTDFINPPERIAMVDSNTFMYTDSCHYYQESFKYYLSTVELKNTASGSFYNESAFLKDSIVITSYSDAQANFSFNQLDFEVEFMNESITSNSWQWDFGDGMSSDEMNPMHTYADRGTYEVTLIASNDCFSDTIVQSITISLTATEDLDSRHISFYPNPVDDHLIINCETCNESQEFDILNSAGQIMQSGIITDGINNIDVSNLTSGLFVINFKSGTSQVMRKFIKFKSD